EVGGRVLAERRLTAGLLAERATSRVRADVGPVGEREDGERGALADGIVEPGIGRLVEPGLRGRGGLPGRGYGPGVRRLVRRRLSGLQHIGDARAAARRVRRGAL